MKNKLKLFLLLLVSFAFTSKASAITALCKYSADDGSNAYIILENYKKYIYFEHFDILSVDDRVSIGAITPLSSILGVGTLINYFPTMQAALAGNDGMSLYFDPSYDNVVVESFMYDSLETKFKTTYVNSQGFADAAVKLQLKNANICPNVLFYDGDGVISIEDAEIKFASAQGSEMSDSNAFWANNKVYTRQVDLIADNYKSDNTVSILRAINTVANGGSCPTILANNQANMDLALSYLTMGVSYGNITGAEKHFIAKGLSYESSLDSVDSIGFSYRALAQKIEERTDIDTAVSSACGVDATGLRTAAKTYNHAYEVTSDFGSDEVADCEGVIGDPNDEGSFAYYLQIILDFIQYGGVGLVIVLTTIELIRAVTSNDKDEVNKVMGKTMTRVICMILLFVLPIVVNLLLNIFHVYGNCGIK